jgi:hypothetical protein
MNNLLRTQCVTGPDFNGDFRPYFSFDPISTVIDTAVISQLGEIANDYNNQTTTGFGQDGGSEVNYIEVLALVLSIMILPLLVIFMICLWNRRRYHKQTFVVNDNVQMFVVTRGKDSF